MPISISARCHRLLPRKFTIPYSVQMYCTHERGVVTVEDGVRTGTIQKLTEFTVTPEIRLAGGLVVRPEYRHDSSNKESFYNGTKKSQDTYALAAMYRW